MGLKKTFPLISTDNQKQGHKHQIHPTHKRETEKNCPG